MYTYTKTEELKDGISGVHEAQNESHEESERLEQAIKKADKIEEMAKEMLLREVSERLAKDLEAFRAETKTWLEVEKQDYEKLCREEDELKDELHRIRREEDQA